MTRALIVIALALLIAGCGPAQPHWDASDVASHMDGKLVHDDKGCVYTVTRSSGWDSTHVNLRFVKEISDAACTFSYKARPR